MFDRVLKTFLRLTKTELKYFNSVRENTIKNGTLNNFNVWSKRKADKQACKKTPKKNKNKNKKEKKKLTNKGINIFQKEIKRILNLV